MGLEVPTNKTPGAVIRDSPAPRPAIIGFCILALTAIELVFMLLVFVAIGNGANQATDRHPGIAELPLGNVLANEQSIISFWLACTFFCLGFITLLYQRYFMDHVTVAKRRFRKWEDEGVQLHD
ncbi:MAG: DUF7318 family protein [Thermoplasmatota archaeon]